MTLLSSLGAKRLLNILSIIVATDRRAAILAAIACTLGAIADVGAVGLLAPFLKVIAEPELIDTHWMIVPIRNALAIQSSRSFLVVLCLATIGGLFTLAATRIWARYRIVRFIHGQRDILCTKLLRGQFYTTYWGQRERSTRELIESVFSDIDVFVDKAVRPSTELLSNLLLSSLFFVALLVMDPLGMLLLAVCSVIYFAVLFGLTRRGIDASSRLRAIANTNRFRYAIAILDGRRDIRVYGVDRPFFTAFSTASREFARSVAANQILYQVSAYLTLAIAFSGIVAGITYAIARGATFSSAAPTLGIFFLAGTRLVPALAGIFQGWSELRFAGPAVDALQATLESVAASPPGPEDDLPLHPLLLTKRISFGAATFGYPNGRIVRCDENLSIQAGDIVGISGESGSGKSAFFLSLMGMLPLKEGAIFIDDTELTMENRRAWLANISYIGQAPFFLDATIACNIAFGIPTAAQDRARIIEAAKAAGAHEFITADCKNGYDELVGEAGLRLSGGQRQRVAIARALHANRQVLLLDEMTSSLDPASEKTVLNTLERLRGKHTIIVVTHRLEPLEICNVVLRIDDGVLYKTR